MYIAPEKIVAGAELLASMRAARDAIPEGRYPGTRDSEALCALQRKEAGRGILGAVIESSLYGYSVRYDSGLQNFGLLASSKSRELDGSLEAAQAWCRSWVAEDPSKRYAWRR